MLFLTIMCHLLRNQTKIERFLFLKKKQKKQHFFQKTQVWTFPLLSVMLCSSPEQTTVNQCGFYDGDLPLVLSPHPPTGCGGGGEGVASPSQTQPRLASAIS